MGVSPVKLVVRTVATVFVVALGLAAARVHPGPATLPATAAAQPPLSSARVPAVGWFHPDWFPEAPDLDAVASMDAHGPERGPSLRSRSAFVYDLDAGEVLFEKNADVVRPVASITKLVASLALVSVDPDLDATFCIGAEQYPTRSGARSRLSTGDCLAGWDVLGAALVASDNRAAYGLAAAGGLGVDAFIQRMNEVSADLGMDHSTWTDPSGLEDDNLSSARDIARATVAVALHPVLSTVASAPFWDLHRDNRSQARRLFSTDRMAGREDLEILAAKTGYTDTARYCFSTLLRAPSGRRVVVTLLGADGKLTRWAEWTASCGGWRVRLGRW